MDDLPIQIVPLSIFAAIVLGAVLLAALRARLRSGTRVAAIAALRRDHRAADRDVVPLFADGAVQPALAVVDGAQVGVAEHAGAGGGDRMRAVERATLVCDAGGRVGLRVQLAGGGSHVAVDLDGIVRLYDRLNEAAVPLAFEVAPGAEQRLQQRLARLLPKEQELLRESLQVDKGEVLLDLVPGVSFAGRLHTPGSLVGATLVVTNVRVSLLARTQTMTQGGGTRTTTTHFSMVSYPLPLVERVVVTRAGGLRRRRLRWSFRWKQDVALPPDRQLPDLLLDTGCAAVVFPLAICRVDVQAHAPAPGLFGPLLRSAIGFGVLGAVLGAVPPWIYWGAGGGSHAWAQDWIATSGLCGAIAAAALRCLSAYELFEAQRAEAALTGVA